MKNGERGSPWGAELVLGAVLPERCGFFLLGNSVVCDGEGRNDWLYMMVALVFSGRCEVAEVERGKSPLFLVG